MRDPYEPDWPAAFFEWALVLAFATVFVIALAEVLS